LENLFFKYFIIILASIQAAAGIAELSAPSLLYALWRKWIGSRFFFIHGLLLIAAGFPLTIYKGEFSGVLFLIGLLIVLTGPFVLLYPEKIKKAFYEAEADLEKKHLIRFIYIDSIMRIGFALILFLSYYRTFYSNL
jgi:hypothetical protein